MAVMVPDLSAEELTKVPSRAEVKVYNALRSGLPSRFTVFHSAKWILKVPHGSARDGEADFIITADDRVLILEVKGGGIHFDPTSGHWSSVDGSGARHSIRDPIEQALKAKYAIRAKLKEHPGWGKSLDACLFGHAVFFPDLRDSTPLIRADAPRELIGSYGTLANVAEWVESAFSYWANQSSLRPGGSAGIARFLKELLARPIDARPMIAARLAEEEETRIQLTRQQAKILGMLGGRRRAAIAGGAGTGKTLLAAEKACKLAAEGFQTLLTCFNRPLADHLSRAYGGVTGLQVLGFHQLCSAWVEQASLLSGRHLLNEAKAAYPSADLYDVHMPFALATAIELLPNRFDAVVVDEGQDFRQEYWLPLELALKEPDESPLFVFYDQNQNLYKRAATFPITDEPFVLTSNCRNTRVIHNAAYRYFRGEVTEPPSIAGSQVELLPASSPTAQAERIGALVTRLISQERVAASDIVVLVLDAGSRQALYRHLENQPLPRPAKWRVESHGDRDGVLIETANRFKGLEAAIVILWGIDTIAIEQSREVLYVALSRAKSMLYLCGSERACSAVFKDFSTP